MKIAPDLTSQSVYELSQLINKYDIDGVICTNTTIDKKNLTWHDRISKTKLHLEEKK